MKFKITLIVFAAFLVASCSSRKRVVNENSKNKVEKKEVESKFTPKKEQPKTKKKVTYKDAKGAYIAKYSEIAMEEMRRYKIPASITLAQGVLESRSGQSQLTTRSNNHFGIKCHKGWTGGKTYHDDDEKGECFRVYKHPEKSFRDHSLFLAERKRYAGLFELKITDYKGWAKGLKKAGYATDKSYPQKLISIIETHELYDYDDLVLGKKKRKRVKKEEYVVTPSKVSSKGTIEVQYGESLYSISKRFGLTIDELKKMNNLKSNNLSVGQMLLVKEQKKRKQNDRKEKLITVKKGDTLYGLAKKHKVTVTQLKDWNRLLDNTLSIGQELIVNK
ncbi:glucosaminidase domain-containing protein [Urechidicola vernalis]|uniref:Peptidoglycan hydrolase n=1 Tax=Urechidicola vernalis TaxID=3075600 RepID=A0ABU2Y513_9FLAO|nr:glucosaminidase domain-containing protein [Urechidicola sp. P050]MDT0553284.1 LysM peptidoglycan-binding domain-containing protein [Urechidicola sp. P050]